MRSYYLIEKGRRLCRNLSNISIRQEYAEIVDMLKFALRMNRGLLIVKNDEGKATFRQ